MNVFVENVLEEVRGAWRFRWQALWLASGLCALAWIGILFLPDTYEASARVFVDTRTTLGEATRGITMDSNVDTQLQRVRQALLGGPQLDEVARETNLYARALTPQQRQLVVGKLRENISLTGSISPADPTAGLYVISYTANKRQQALDVVDRLLKAFVDSTIGGKRAGAEQAEKFLTTQIADYERRLSAAEERLATFKKHNVGLMPGAQGDYFTRLQAEMDGVGKAQAMLAIALQRRGALQRQLRGETPYMASGGGRSAPQAQSSSAGAPAGSDISSQIRESQLRLDDLLLRFTEKHPDVIALRQTLAELEQRQQKEIAAIRRGDPGAVARIGLNANPVFQNIQLQANQAEVEVAALRAEIGDRQRKIAELRTMLNTAPEVEAEFARLNRDYDVTRAQHQALVERLGRARLSEQAEATGVVRFEIVDPPSANFVPVAPKRAPLVLLVFMAALAAGAALAYVLHKMRPVFNNPRQLTELTGLPVLGAVSMTWLEKHEAAARRGLLMYAAAASVLLLAAALSFLLVNRLSKLVQQLIT